MIEQVLALVTAKAEAADALLREEMQISLKFESGRLKENAFRQETGLNLRLVKSGRVGFAGTTDSSAPEDVVARALASAEQGEACALDFPGREPLPNVATFDDRVAVLDVAALAALGRRVVEPLSRPGWQVSASVDWYSEQTTFANSAGQAWFYPANGLGVAAQVTRVGGDDVLMVYDDVTTVGVPTDEELDRIARSIIVRIERAERVVEPPEGKLPVLFTPKGSTAVFLPLRQALSGKAVLQGVSPLAGKIGEGLFDAALDIRDEPLLDRRAGSRPADDEGVPSRSLALVESGTLSAFVYDLETAARAGTRSTGHGRRSTFGKPGIRYSNLVTRPGTADEAALLAEVGHGLVVDEFIGVGQGNVISGAFSHPVALAYRVDGGEITGRVKGAAVAGNCYDLLKRIRLVGRDAEWVGGSRLVPPLVLDAVNVARR